MFQLGDLSSYSDEELQAMLQDSSPAPTQDLSSYSDAELASMLNDSTSQEPLSWGDSAKFVGGSFATGLAKTADFASMLTNPFQSVENAIGGLMGVPKKPTALELTNQLLDKSIGRPENIAQGTTADIVRATMEGTAVPIGGPVGNALAAASGEGLKQAAPDLPGASIIGSVIPSLLTGGTRAAYRGIANYLGPQTQKGVLAETGRALEQIVSPSQLDQGLAAIDNVPLGNLRTSAEVVKSPKLAILEQTLGSGSNALEYAAAKQARADEATKLLETLSQSKGLPSEVSGALTQEAIASAKESSKSAVNKLYEAIPKNQVAPLEGVQAKILDGWDKYYGKGSPDLPKSLKDRIEFIFDPANAKGLDIQTLQRLRSHIGDIATTAHRSGDNTLGAFANSIKDGLKETIELAPVGASEWKAANAAYSNYAGKFKEGPLAKIADVLPSRVTDKILSSPEAAKQFVTMVDGEPQAIKSIKDEIVSSLGTMSDAQKVNFISKNESELKSLLNDDFSVLAAIRGDIKSRIDTSKLANATTNSNTALKLSSVVEKALTGKEPRKASGIWEAAKLLGFGGAAYANPAVGVPAAIGVYGAKGLRDRSTGLVKQSLFDALQDPKKLKQALTAAGKAAPKQSLGSLQAKSLAGALFSNKIAQQESSTPQSLFGKEDTSTSKKENTSMLTEIKGGIKHEDLYKAVIKQESGGNAKAVSSVGAEGLMQVMPATAKDIAKELGVREYDLKDPETNKKFGQYYLDKLLAHYDGDPELALTAYHSGMGRVDRLLAKNDGTKLADIIDDLGPVGQKYAKQVLARIA